MVIADTKKYKTNRWADFNRAFVKMNILTPVDNGGYHWLYEEDIPSALNRYPNVKEDKIIADLLTKYPISHFKDNRAGFIKNYELPNYFIYHHNNNPYFYFRNR